jgi:HEAT repeat protein
MSVEVLVAFVSGVVFLLLLLAIAIYLLVRKGTRPVPPEAMYIFRVVLALAGAAFAAILPGFLNIETKLVAVAVQASGALAVFVLIYRINPPVLLQAQLSAPKKAAKPQVEKLIERLKHGDERRRREAALALSKLGPAAEVALPDLIEALSDPDPHVRENVAQALEAGGSAAVRHLVVALRHQKGLAVIGETPMIPRPVPRLMEVIGEDDVRGALVEVGPAAVPALMDALQHGAPALKAPTAAALRKIQSGELDQVITRAVSDEDDEIRLGGAIALAESASAANVPALAALLQDSDRRIRVVGIAGLGRSRSREAIASLIEALNREKDSVVRYEAVRALRQLAEHTREAIPPLVGALKDPTLLVQLAAVMALGEIGPSAGAAIPELVNGLKHTDWTLRQHAAMALGNIGADDALPALTEALKDEHEKVRQAATEALQKIQGNPFKTK